MIKWILIIWVTNSTIRQSVGSFSTQKDCQEAGQIVTTIYETNRKLKKNNWKFDCEKKEWM